MFKLFLRMVRELFLPKVLELFWSKAVEMTADDAHSNLKNMCDFECSLKTLQTNLKSLSAKASDVREQIKNAELSSRKKRKREVEEWLEEVKSFEREVVEMEAQVESQGFIMRLMDGGKAAELNEQAEKLVEQSRDFGELVLDVCGTSGEIFLTDGMVGEGFSENLGRIIKLLKTREVELVLDVCGTSGEIFLTDGMVGEGFSENLGRIIKLLKTREVSRIGVYGMGGVGKTTLVKHVNNRLLQQSEGRVFWITVSQEFTIMSLQDKIARLLGVNLSDKDEEDMRATRLHKALSQEKSLVLILDDVWQNIDMKKVGCTFSSESCRLIVTTRSLEVCHQVLCQEVIHVVKLHEAEAWKLFNESLGIGTELGPQVEKVAKSVAKLCGGLPLAIITMAGCMRGKKDIHTWRNAFVELQERVMGQDSMGDGDDVFEVLKYSFDRLKKRTDKSNEFNMVQLCFLYCSLYPEDFIIEREGLVGKFISTGLVSQRKSRRARIHQGHSILDKLVSVCLLESCVDYKNDESVKMHDLVRGMALKIGEAKYLVVRAGDQSLNAIYAPNEEEWTKDVEMASLVRCSISRIEEGISPDCPKLSTLLLWRNCSLQIIPDSFFSKMQGLCTLDLCRTGNLKVLPDSIGDMKSLKSLLLEGCHNLEKGPYLGKLKALRELNLSNTAIKEVPQGLDELLNLELLSIDAYQLTPPPSGWLSKLVHLQHVRSPFHLEAPMDVIQNLGLLEEFHGGVGCVEDFNSFIRSRESHRERDTWYRIAVIGHVFHGFSRVASSYKKQLTLSRCSLENERVLGQGTECLIVHECEGLSISFLNDFSALKKLIIYQCGGIEWIMRSDGQISNTLEHIRLVNLDHLKGVVMKRGDTTSLAQAAVFSTLKRLFIYKCKKMRKVGLPASGVPNLEEIEIRECREMEGIFEDEGGDSFFKLKSLTLSKLPRMRQVGLAASGVPNLEHITVESCGEIQEVFNEDETQAASLPKLKEMNLSYLPTLKSVSKATIVSNSIEKIYIWKCPRLMNKLPLHFDDPAPPPTLREIRVEREWWESLTQISPNLALLLLPFVKFEHHFSSIASIIQKAFKEPHFLLL